jgi:hypothetical protein
MQTKEELRKILTGIDRRDTKPTKSSKIEDISLEPWNPRILWTLSKALNVDIVLAAIQGPVLKGRIISHDGGERNEP